MRRVKVSATCGPADPVLSVLLKNSEMLSLQPSTPFIKISHGHRLGVKPSLGLSCNPNRSLNYPLMLE